MELSERKKAILQAIIEDYIASAEPDEKPAVSKKKSRNQVGSMFDLLTFSDI